MGTACPWQEGTGPLCSTLAQVAPSQLTLVSCSCFSGVGRSGGMQVVSLAPACLRRGRGIVLHELMHVLGFWHEHSRADRDRYIRVNWHEILPGEPAGPGPGWGAPCFLGTQSAVMLDAPPAG